MRLRSYSEATMTDNWEWQRFWTVLGDSHQLFTMGFLPSNPFQVFQPLEALAEKNFLVLLGEPGSGKSVELARDYQRILSTLLCSDRSLYLDGRTLIRSEQSLYRYWFDSGVWQDWTTSDNKLWVYFDGFDESHQVIENLAAIIKQELGQTLQEDRSRATRLYLRIGSRSIGWDRELGDFLALHLTEEGQPPGNFSYWLAPPRWDDIAIAATHEGLDGTDFCLQLRNGRIEALALRPAQLKWLLNSAKRGTHLPNDKVSLYWEGIKQVCQVPDGHLPLEPEIMRALAARIAFATVFSQAECIWVGPDSGDIPPDAILLSKLAGGVESFGPVEFEASSLLLNRVVRSGLFTQVEPDQIIWAHQTFPEFLAAKYCSDMMLPVSQALFLVTNPQDVGKKILPNLTEVASWLSVMSPEILAHILQYDPRALIESDVAFTLSEDRQRLLIASLDAIQEGRSVSTRWPSRDQFAKLNFPGIEDVLRHYIEDGTFTKEVRDTAIDIAVDCQLHSLGSVLAKVALDDRESEVVRRSSAWAVARLDDETSHLQLKALLVASEGTDPYDDLKGCALRSNWPSNLTVTELLPHISAPRWQGLGAYRLFIGHDFVDRLPDQDLKSVLNWLPAAKAWGDDDFDLPRITEQLIYRAFAQFDDSEIQSWLVERIATNLLQYHPWIGRNSSTIEIEDELLGESQTRRALLIALCQTTENSAELATIAFSLGEPLRRHPDWIAEDLEWCIKQLLISPPDSSLEAYWLKIVLECVRIVPDVNSLEPLFGLYLSRFSATFASLFEPIGWQSEEANAMRRHWQMQEGTCTTDDGNVEIEPFIVDYLDQIDRGAFQQWWYIDDWLQVDTHGRRDSNDWDAEITKFPGWNSCSPKTKHRIISAAPQFLEAHEPHVETLGTNKFYKSDHAAYRALILIHNYDHEAYTSISTRTWNKLGTVILGMSPRSSSETVPLQSQFLAQAITSGFETESRLATMADLVSEQSTFAFSAALALVTDTSSNEQLVSIAPLLINSDRPFAAILESIRLLGAKKVPGVVDLTLEVANMLSGEVERKSELAGLITVVMDSIDTGQWTNIERLLADDDNLFSQVFLAFSQRHRDASDFATILSEPEVASLYSRLQRLFPLSEDLNVMEVHVVTPRESIGQWREDLLTSLAHRGTWEAVGQLKRLAEQFPEVGWLHRRVAEAEEEARRRTWRPASVEELLKLARDKSRRFVSTPNQLSSVILESLADLQLILSGESPAAVDLWNSSFSSNTRIWSPKDELLISDYVKRFLDTKLGTGGILINREVENRIGNENDLYVQCIDPVSKDIITVVCEVKGCWNSDLYTSMKNQLVDRYLKEQKISHGIYLVGYFDCAKWDPGIRHYSRRHSLNELRYDLENQASLLSNEDYKVTSIVLDCCI